MFHKTLSVTLMGAALLAGCSSSSSGKKPLSGAQTGSTTIDLGTEDVAFTQPKQIKMDGTATYDDVADTVTVALTLTNKSKTVLHNPKVLVSGVSEGAVTGDGTYGLSPTEGAASDYVYFGPESIPPGGTASRDVEFTGVTGVGTELTFDVEIIQNAWAFVPANDDGIQAVDISGTGNEIDLFNLGEIQDFGWDGDSWQWCAAMSPDTRYVYYTNRNQPAIITFDTVDQTLTMGESLIGGDILYDATGVLGCIDGLTTSPDGETLYATVSHDVHIASNTGDYPTPSMIEVVKLSAKNLSVKGRVTVWTDPGPPPVSLSGEGGGSPPYNPEIRGRQISVTPDGTRGAVSISGASECSLLNLSSMSVIDTYTTAGFHPRYAAVSPDADYIVVNYTWRDDSDGTLEMIDTDTGVGTDLIPDTLDAGTSTYSPFLEWGPDGRLYYGRAWNASVPGLSIWEPVGDTWVEVTGLYGNAIHFGEDYYALFDDQNSELHMYDYTDVELDFPATLTSPLATTVGSWGHGLVVTE